MLVNKSIRVRELRERGAVCRRSLREICDCGCEIGIFNFHVCDEALLLRSGVLHLILDLIFRRKPSSKIVESLL